MPNPVDRVPLYIYEGEDYQHRFDVVTRGDEGTPYDVTGMTAIMEIRDAETGGILHTSSSGNGQVVVGTNEVTVFIPSSFTQDAGLDAANYDLFVVNGGLRHPVARGPVQFYDAVTQS